MRTNARTIPWWLTGEERCVVCLQRYSLQVERRCTRCDDGVCPFCAITVRATHEIVCRPCADDAARED